MNKILSAIVPTIYPEVETHEIMGGATKRIHMWGLITYYDAFDIRRFVKFSVSFFYLADGVSSMSMDTTHHDDFD